MNDLASAQSFTKAARLRYTQAVEDAEIVTKKLADARTQHELLQRSRDRYRVGTPEHADVMRKIMDSNLCIENLQRASMRAKTFIASLLTKLDDAVKADNVVRESIAEQ